MLDAIARTLFGTASLNPAFALSGTAPAPTRRAASRKVPVILAGTGGGDGGVGGSPDTPLAWADFGRGF